ncbi:hypothetical protein QFZ75_002603 [Streptomyces sp. V3I8]|nr:hypothetical protein [Streptomyces sp. V3I8]
MLSAGLGPGDQAGRRREAVRGLSGVRTVEWPGLGHAVRAETAVVENGRLGRGCPRRVPAGRRGSHWPGWLWGCR